MPALTNHGKRRLSERNGVQKGCAKKIAKRAFRNGITHQEALEDLKKMMDKMFLSRRNANKISFYGNSLYLFHNDILITTINVPQYIVDNLEHYVTPDGYERYLNFKRSIKRNKIKKRLEVV